MGRRTYALRREVRTFQEAAVAVEDADTEVAVMPLDGQEVLSFRVANGGDEALTGLSFAFLFHDDGDAIVVAAAAAAFTTPTWPVLYCSADPTGLTAGAEVFGQLDVTGCRQLTISADAGTDATTVLTVEGTAQ